jgi:hypothetical protein
VLTRDRASVLAMADDYGAKLVEGSSVRRARPQGWDDVARAHYIDDSLPAEERLTAAVVRAEEVVIPAQKEIRDFLRRGNIQCRARRNGSGDIENVGREQWGGLRLCSFEGRDIAVPVNSESDPLPLAGSLADYLSGSVPANGTPAVWVDLEFSAEQVTRLWRPNESSVVDSASLSVELGVRAEEAPVPPPAVCVEQNHRAAYARRVEEFRKTHPGRNPPVQNTKSGLQGDREWATAKGISRPDITKWRREVLGEQKGGRPKNPTRNSAQK